MYFTGKGIQENNLQNFEAKDPSLFQEDLDTLIDRHTKERDNLISGFNEFSEACHSFCSINKQHLTRAENALKNNDVDAAITILNEWFGEMNSFPDSSVRMEIRKKYGNIVMEIVKDMLDNLNTLSIKLYEQRDEVVKELQKPQPDFGLVFDMIHNIKEELIY